MSTVSLSPAEPLIADVVFKEAQRGLTAKPKQLPAWLFYDEAGSLLFEQITDLPEYYLTRTERKILARDSFSLTREFPSRVTIAELGAGTATKTGLLLRAFAGAQGSLLYQPIDISPSALAEAEASLSTGLENVLVEPQTANYITERYTIARPKDHQILALYIGSSIGNFSPDEATSILRRLHSYLAPGDALLLGVDLAPGPQKSVAMLLAAYDDAAGVTAAFNKNVLIRLNREVQADFNLDLFAHRARWNAEHSRIEMHLESLADQTVHLGEQVISFKRGETIHTENSYKFTQAGLLELLRDSGFALQRTMGDNAGLFAVVLARAV